MLLERITLHNFRAFPGRHAIDLAPESPARPIILVTGLNGSGKTTILEALHLALYGKRTPSPRRTGQAYERYLEECRHRASEPVEEAGVELSFSQVKEGIPITYELRRFWSTARTSIRERFEVVADGIQDPVLEDNWDQHIEELLPARLAPLFFFDGEKIESLADLDAAAQVLSVAIHSLLGLDLVDQLHHDLERLESKKAASHEDADRLGELKTLQEQSEAAKSKARKAYEELASVNSQLDRARIVLRQKEEEYESRGGLAFDQRQEHETAVRDAERAIVESRRQLQELAAGYAPLLLVPQLLNRVSGQVAAEKAGKESRLLARLLEERDQSLLRELKAVPDAERWLGEIEEWLARDRRKRSQGGVTDETLRVSSEGANQLDHLLSSALPRVELHVRDALERHRILQQDLANARKRLAAVPEEGSVRDVRRKRDEAQEEVARLEALSQLRREAFEVAERAAAEVEKRMQSAHLQAVNTMKERSTALRLVEHSAKVRSTLNLFREKVLRRHIERIEELILEGLHSLLHKEQLVSGLKISPDTFRFRLYGADNRELPPELLSAGERQLLAIALLWGLARAARRPIPTLIDTPLGRLDSSHRRHLVDRYFPSASHQVILLSTDEEIAGTLRERLEPAIGRAYLLQHDDSTGTSSVTTDMPKKAVAS